MTTNNISLYHLKGRRDGMIQRCENPNHAGYKNYGGRGISVCKRWKESFENFYADMGDCPKGLTLERKDNDGNYCPENCCWATWEEQENNKRIPTKGNGSFNTLHINNIPSALKVIAKVSAARARTSLRLWILQAIQEKLDREEKGCK